MIFINNGWILFTLVICLSFNCNLRAYLVAADYEKPIDSMQQEELIRWIAMFYMVAFQMCLKKYIFKKFIIKDPHFTIMNKFRTLQIVSPPPIFTKLILSKLVNESSIMMTICQDRFWAFSNIPYFDQLGKIYKMSDFLRLIQWKRKSQWLLQDRQRVP